MRLKLLGAERGNEKSVRLSEKRFLRGCAEEPAESLNLLISTKLILTKLVMNLTTGTA
jgi:hypothetical protein